MNRRDVLKIGAAATVLGAARLGWVRLARPAEPAAPLSAAAAALLEQCWKGLDASQVLDCHAHLIGVGAGGTGATVHEHLRQPIRHPIHGARFAVYEAAAGITDLDQGDQQYVARLLSLVTSQTPHGRLLLLAFDRAYREDGTIDAEATEFYTPNDYALSLAKVHPDCFLAAASIHPYRADALAELDRCVALGATAVKWLPNAMLIDPASPRCDAFYARLVALGVPLLTHAGEEKAVDAGDAQKYGNPQRLRRALDAGVKVIVAHCASLGTNLDLDRKDAVEVENFELFLRLASDPKYADRLYGDVSAMLLANRVDAFRRLLRHEALYPRLLNGSDYPLPAINLLNRTGKLVSLGLITEAQRTLLNELDQHNPLAFDFAMKRLARIEDEDGKVYQLPDSVFMAPRGLFPAIA